MTTSDNPIGSFWWWFAEVSGALSSDPENERLLTELDRRIRSFGPLAWEIGPGLKKEWQLALSPGGNPSLLARTKEVVEQAPSLREWEFYYAKQPRDWQFSFAMVDHDGRDRALDANLWTYILSRLAECRFNITVTAPELMDMPEDFQIMAVEIFLDGAIGEESRLRLFESIEVADSASREADPKGIAAPRLADHLRSLHCL